MVQRFPVLVLLLVASSLSISFAWSPSLQAASVLSGNLHPHASTSASIPETTFAMGKSPLLESPVISHRSSTTALFASRRDFVVSTAAAVSAALLTGSPVFAADGNVFADKNFSVDDAKKRLKAAQKDLKDLLQNYDDISKSGGDAVRNALGTQGVNSNLYGIQKVLKILRDESEDIVEYTEAMDEFNAYYYQAEGAAYQSLFVEHSSAKGTPEGFLKTAKADIQQCDKLLDKVAAQVPN